MKTKRIPKLILCLGLLIFTACTNKKGVKTLKLAHSLDVSHPVHKAMEFMAIDVAERSNNQLQIKIYPNQQLGTERQCLELLQIGSLDMTKVSAAVMENFSPNMKVFGLPFLFNNKQHAFEILDGPVGKKLLNDSQKYMLKGLGYYDSGSRSFYTKTKNIHSPEDLEGMKIRVMESVTAMKMVNQLGGSPTPISWGELYTSLQQGVVDGAENNPPVFYLSRHYEVCKFYALDEHTSIPDVLIGSTHMWNRLNDNEKVWLQAAANASVKHQRKLWQTAEEDALRKVQEAGVEVIRPDKKAFQEKVAPMYAAYKKDPEIKKIINQIQKQ